MKFVCSECNKEYEIASLEYKCQCGGLFQLKKEKREEVNIEISLGEVKTPVLKRKYKNLDLYFKLDYLMPTGSFKDRGALVLINHLKNLGIKEVVEDSSGNAGASISAYCAAADIKCKIFVPESTSEGKIKQIKAYGSEIVKVSGSRDDTAKATLNAAQNTYYASHVYNPLFFEGTKSIALEIYEQVGIPDFIFVPVGNGTMLLGVYLGFLELGKLPPIIGVQSENCCPIYNKFYNIEKFFPKKTLAEGIAVQESMRIKEIIKAIKESKGDIITVSEEEIAHASQNLSRMGIYVETTAAAVVGGVERYFKNKSVNNNAKIVVPLTGIGLKK